MDLQQKSSRHAVVKTNLASKKPPAPPPRKSSVPTVSSSAEKVCPPSNGQKHHQKVSAILSKPKLSKENAAVGPSVPPRPPPYAILVPTTPTPVNSSAFPAREPTACLPRSISCDQMNQGQQFDIHGDAIADHMVPIPVSAPQPPPVEPNKIHHLTPRKTTASITLKDLADYHFPKFPLCVQILEGYMSSHVPHLTFSTADIYNIHLLKRQEVVVAKDSLGHQYNIPLNTAIQFGLLPSIKVLQACGNNNPESNTVLTFNKVSDITTMKVLPKVICVTKAIKGEGEQGSVEVGEILAVEKVSKRKKKKVLEVFSVTKKAQKILCCDCSGHFTTSPRQVAMYLPELLEHISDVLPCQVLLFFNEGSPDEKSNFSSTSLSNGVITLTEKKVEMSLVASTVFEDAELDLESDDCLLDIPLDENLSQLEVTIVTSSDTYSRKRLRTATQNILKNVNLSKLRSYRDATSDNVYATQTMLYSTHHVENDRLGVEFETPLEINLESTSTQGGASDPEAYDILPQRSEDSGSGVDQMYETIPAKTSVLNKSSTSLQSQTRLSASINDLEDSVFTSENGPSTLSASNLDLHPRTPIIKDGFYQTPRSHPSGCHPVNYDYPPSHSMFLKSGRKSLSSSDTKLSLPSANIQHMSMATQQQNILPESEIESHDDLSTYEDMESVRTSNFSLSAFDGNLEYEVFNPPAITDQSIAALNQKINTLQKECKILSEKVTSLEQAKLSSSQQNVVDRIDHLENEVKCCMKLLQSNGGKRKDAAPEGKIYNKELLQRATSDQILRVLDSMGLHQYKEAFSRESIDGAVLLELDEEVLSCELGIKSRIHCVKLTKLISGEYSIQELLPNPCD